MEKKESFKRIKRMTLIKRFNHELILFLIIISTVTGFYIGNPYYQSFIADTAVEKYVMAYNRLIHLLAGVILNASFLVIIYLYFFSRFKKAYLKIIPNKQNLIEFFEVLLNLITLNKRKKFSSNYSDSFNIVFFAIFHLLLFWMILTGFQLYVQGFASGYSSIGSWWPWLLHLLTDWVVVVTGGTYIDVRYSHHLAMYLIIIWSVLHIYYQIWRSIFWGEEDVSIFTSGSKYIKIKKDK